MVKLQDGGEMERIRYLTNMSTVKQGIVGEKRINLVAEHTNKYIIEKLHNETGSKDRSKFHDFSAPRFLLNQKKSDT